jgi:hypothetical protein
LESFLLYEKPNLLIFLLNAPLLLQFKLFLLDLTGSLFGLAIVFFETMYDGVVLDDDALSVED